MGTTTSIQPPITLSPLRPNEGVARGPEHKDYPNHVADTLNTASQPPLNSMLEKIASILDPKDDGRVTRCSLPDQDSPSTELEGIQLMTCDYIKGKLGHYMPRESFLHLRKYERTIEKITLPTPIHSLDHIIIPINIRKSHWFPAHMNLQTRSISLLDSSQAYSAAAYPQQKLLIWKFFRMVCTSHASAVAPGPHWTIPPEKFIGLHPRLTNLTPGMMQTLRHCKQITIRSIMDTTNEHIKTSWIRRGISPELAGTQTTDPPGHNWIDLEQTGTPQQNNSTNTKATRLACHISRT